MNTTIVLFQSLAVSSPTLSPTAASSTFVPSFLIHPTSNGFVGHDTNNNNDGANHDDDEAKDPNVGMIFLTIMIRLMFWVLLFLCCFTLWKKLFRPRSHDTNIILVQFHSSEQTSSEQQQQQQQQQQQPHQTPLTEEQFVLLPRYVYNEEVILKQQHDFMIKSRMIKQQQQQQQQQQETLLLSSSSSSSLFVQPLQHHEQQHEEQYDQQQLQQQLQDQPQHHDQQQELQTPNPDEEEVVASEEGEVATDCKTTTHITYPGNQPISTSVPYGDDYENSHDPMNMTNPTDDMTTTQENPIISSTPHHRCCPICIDDIQYNDPIIMLPGCCHIYHVDCIKEWLLHTDASCPMCKEQVIVSTTTTTTPTTTTTTESNYL
jgi:Ring finger domain